MEQALSGCWCTASTVKTDKSLTLLYHRVTMTSGGMIVSRDGMTPAMLCRFIERVEGTAAGLFNWSAFLQLNMIQVC